MARYVQLSEDLHERVEDLFAYLEGDGCYSEGEVSERIGKIINLAIRCHPRPCQGTVRENIVKIAMRGRCNVWKTREHENGRSFNVVHIERKEQ